MKRSRIDRIRLSRRDIVDHRNGGHREAQAILRALAMYFGQSVGPSILRAGLRAQMLMCARIMRSNRGAR